MLRTVCLALAVAVAVTAPPARAADAPNPLAAVVRVKSQSLPDARTAPYLGDERDGSGVLIGKDGLILTIGYLVLEADSVQVTDAAGKTHAATVVAYDHASGFGLLRTVTPLPAEPIELGESTPVKERDDVLVAGFGGPGAATRAMVVSRRPFTGSWEYLLESAIFTSPPAANWGGAALIGTNGKLLGIGSLLVPDALEPGYRVPGNMFVPIDVLKPILGELTREGKRAGPPRAWLGLSTEEVGGRLVVVRVAPEGPAAKAGIGKNDIVTAIDGSPVTTQAELYRKLWAKGAAGAPVTLKVLQGASLNDVKVKSMDRADYLRTKQAL